MNQDNRLLGADFLRATACMGVLLHHLAFRMDMNSVPDAIQPVLRFLVYGSFGVSVFFVLSGFLLARPFWLALDAGKPMPSMRTYALRRLARIVPGFWLALIVSLCLDLMLGGKVLDGERIIRFVAGLLLVSDWHWVTLFPVDNNGPLWSIGFEVTAYLLLPLGMAALFAAKARDWPARLLWIGVIAVVLLVHWMAVQWAPIDEVERGWNHGLVGGAKAWMPRFNPIGFFAIFAFGGLAAGVQVLVQRHKGIAMDVIGGLAVLATAVILAVNIGGLSEGFGWLGIPYAFPIMPIAVGVALIALPSSVYLGRWLDIAPLRFIAKISFGIYVWHFLIMWLIEKLVPGAFDTSGDTGWATWLQTSGIVIAVTFVVATLSFYLLEQPAVRWARKLEQPGRRDEAPAGIKTAS
ncbi:acyltransferase [Devosia sp. BK]|uniref:acyltransferase family protein n=1 Tax=Devosia sp. BK TaxID=2871706 RepID=UPI002939FAFF|nr:acyltransferase [Devosia sp. BK]MDV3251381.1 acyltransferase [Devosia sp. BK]